MTGELRQEKEEEEEEQQQQIWIAEIQASEFRHQRCQNTIVNHRKAMSLNR